MAAPERVEDLLAEDEDERIAAVRRYDILDTPPDGAFDRIAALAARHFDTPIAIVSIVDSDRIWFKSHHGLDVEEIPRDPGLCASAILQDDAWVVENAAVDPRTLANPLVAGDFGLRFYAGAPLTTRDGHNLGTLCVIDRQPRVFAADDEDVLKSLAAIVMDELELRLAARRAVAREHELRRQAERTARTLQASLLPTSLPALPGAEVAVFYDPAADNVVGGDFYDVFPSAAGGWWVLIGDISGKGPEAAANTTLVRFTARAAALQDVAPESVLATVNDAMLGFDVDGPPRFCTLLVAHMQPRGDGPVDVRVASAGHPPAIVLRSGGGAFEEVGELGVLAGVFDDADYRSAAAVLRSGDAFIAYTDGVIEVGRPLTVVGVDDVAALAAGADGGSAERIAKRLDAGLLAWGERRDDAAAIVVTIR